MRKTKHVLFTFSPYEYKGVEGYLNEQAERGWELVKVGSILAKFRRTQRTALWCRGRACAAPESAWTSRPAWRASLPGRSGVGSGKGEIRTPASATQCR